MSGVGGRSWICFNNKITACPALQARLARLEEKSLPPPSTTTHGFPIPDIVLPKVKFSVNDYPDEPGLPDASQL